MIAARASHSNTTMNPDSYTIAFDSIPDCGPFTRTQVTRISLAGRFYLCCTCLCNCSLNNSTPLYAYTFMFDMANWLSFTQPHSKTPNAESNSPVFCRQIDGSAVCECEMVHFFVAVFICERIFTLTNTRAHIFIPSLILSYWST